MSSGKLFRAILAVDLLMGIVGFASGFFAAGEADEGSGKLLEGVVLQGLLDALPEFMRTLFLVGVLGVFILLLFTAVVTYVGLFLFWDWARFSNLFLWVIYLGTAPFFASTVTSPWEATLAEFSALLGGVILAASFLPPISSRFRRRNQL